MKNKTVILYITLIVIIIITGISCKSEKLIIKSKKYIIYNDYKYNYIENNFGSFGITSLIGDPRYKIFNWVYKINDDIDTNILIKDSKLYVKESFEFPNVNSCLISEVYVNKVIYMNSYISKHPFNFSSILELDKKYQSIKEMNIIDFNNEIINFDYSLITGEFELIFRLYEYEYLCYMGYKIIETIDDIYILSYDNKVYAINELYKSKIYDAINVIFVSMQANI